MLEQLVPFVRDVYKVKGFIPLHAPRFSGNEKRYVADTLDSTFVSSVGEYVDRFEEKIEGYTGCGKAVVTVNGTAALHAALHFSGVNAGDLVITQALTFVATCNAIHWMGAEPVFIDVSRLSLGLCPKALELYLEEFAYIDDDMACRHKGNNKCIRAVVPMHTFGHPVELGELVALCERWNLELVEDAAESLGSLYKGKHTGVYGRFGALSFNGNKIITTGGGGAILCRSDSDGVLAKHVTTTAKIPHQYEYMHDAPGFNYRLPNINSALGCAQMEVLQTYVDNKRALAERYREFFKGSDFQFVSEPKYAKSNYWLNAVICKSLQEREKMLQITNDNGVMTRPIWKLMHRLPMYENCLKGNLSCSEDIESRLVNLPSSPTLGDKKEKH